MIYFNFYVVIGILFSSCFARNETEVSVINGFKSVYPSDAFVVFKGAHDWRGSFNGNMLAFLRLDDLEYMFIAKLTISAGPKVSRSDIKAKAFPFVVDTTHITDPLNRSVTISGKLSGVFSNHKVHVFVANAAWGRQSHNIKGEITFTGRYGSAVDIILT